MTACTGGFVSNALALAVVPEETTFSIRIDLKVKDMIALWMEALHVGLGHDAMKMSDVTRVIDVIGPQTQPSIPDCVAMLLDPSRFPGCRVTHVDMLGSGLPALA